MDEPFDFFDFLTTPVELSTGVCLGNPNAIASVTLFDPPDSKAPTFMGTYSDTLSNNHSRTGNFFDSLTSCLQSVLNSVEKLAQLQTAVPRAPTDEHPAKGDTWSQDTLLVYEGVPVVAVAIRMESSTTNIGLRTGTGKASNTSNAARAVGGIKQGLADRLKAAAAEDVTPEEPTEPQRVMNELAWRITLRSPDRGPTDGVNRRPDIEQIFTGGPFDFNQIEAAFEAIANHVEAAIRAAKTAKNNPQVSQ